MSLGEDYQQTAQLWTSAPDHGGTSNGSLLNGLAIGDKSTSICITLSRHIRPLQVQLRASAINLIQHYYCPVRLSPSQYIPEAGHIDGSVEK